MISHWNWNILGTILWDSRLYLSLVPECFLWHCTSREGSSASLLPVWGGSSGSPLGCCWYAWKEEAPQYHWAWAGDCTLHRNSADAFVAGRTYCSLHGLIIAVVPSWLTTRPPLISPQGGGERVPHYCQVGVEVQPPTWSPLSREPHCHPAGTKVPAFQRPLQHHFASGVGAQ